MSQPDAIFLLKMHHKICGQDSDSPDP